MLRPTPRTSPFAPRPRQAFTLVELLTVIAIIGVLAALIIGSVSKIRDAARRSQCVSNLRQIGAGFNLYAADNRGLYPAPRLLSDNEIPAPYTKTNLPPWINPSRDNWPVEISRYVFRDASIGGVKSAGAEVNIAHCPSYDRLFASVSQLAATNYRTAGYGMNYELIVDGQKIGGGDRNKRRFPAAAINYPSKSILIGDSSDFHLGIGTGWTAYANTDPASNMGKPDGYENGAPYRHVTTANYLYADGHVASLDPDTALAAIHFSP